MFKREDLPGPMKKNGNIIGVSVGTYKNGPASLDVREYYKTDDGDYGPTAKGCRIQFTVEAAKEMIEAIAKVSDLSVTFKPKPKEPPKA